MDAFLQGLDMLKADCNTTMDGVGYILVDISRTHAYRLTCYKSMTFEIKLLDTFYILSTSYMYCHVSERHKTQTNY